MKNQFNQDCIDFVRLHVEKNIDHKLSTYEILKETLLRFSEVLKENEFLREILFTLEQSEKVENRWENILAAKLQRALEENNKKDFCEITNSINNDIFVITIQKKFGKTPQQLLEQSEIRRLKAIQKVGNLSRDLRVHKNKLVEQEKTVQVLTALKTDTPEAVIKTKEDIQLAIDKLNNIIENFGRFWITKELAKMHSSVHSAYWEGWQRAGIASHKASVLEGEVKKLKAAEIKRKFPASRFSMYRKRGNIRNSYSK